MSLREHPLRKTSWFEKLKRSVARKESRQEDQGLHLQPLWGTTHFQGMLLPDTPEPSPPLSCPQATFEPNRPPSSSPSLLLNLPSELILEIAGYLELKDAFALLRTSRHIYPVIRSFLDQTVLQDPNTAMTVLCWALLNRQHELTRVMVEKGPSFTIMNMWGAPLYPRDGLGDEMWLHVPIHQYRIIVPGGPPLAYSILNWALKVKNEPMLSLLRVGSMGERMKGTGRLKYMVRLRWDDTFYTDGHMYMGRHHNVYPYHP